MYTSTRKKMNVDAEDCIVKGISDDGGLFICDTFGEFKINENFKTFTYNEMAKKIFLHFFKTFSENEIDEIVNKSYCQKNFKDKIVDIKCFDKISFLELYHGPTMAFKDMALTVLPHLMVESKKKKNNKKETLILTATSGDTGGACLSGFKDVEGIKVIVLYPTNGVSEFQEAQMHYYTDKNSYAIAIDGNFDDCQSLVKKVFTDDNNFKNIELSSANSINIGRLVPQIVYYFYSYFQMVKKEEIKYGEKINFIVPTGNFGNILACYIAKKMGLFVEKIVCASNENNVLTDFFNTLTYDKNREFYLTNSPAMDILISSNLERLLYLISDNDELLVNNLMKDLKEKGKYNLPSKFKEKLNDFLACSISKKETVDYIDMCYKKYNYLIDPHTAVAYGAYINKEKELNGKTCIVSTASPYKFMETVNDVFSFEKEGISLVEEVSKTTNTDIPELIYDIYKKEVNKIVWEKKVMEKSLRELIGEIDENC